MASVTCSYGGLAIEDILNTPSVSDTNAQNDGDSAHNSSLAGLVTEAPGAIIRVHRPPPIRTSKNEPNVPSGASASSIEARLGSSLISPSASYSSNSSTESRRTVAEYDAALSLLNVSGLKLTTNTPIHCPQEESNLASLAHTGDARGRLEQTGDRNHQVGAILLTRDEFATVLHQKLSDVKAAIDKDESEQEEEKIRGAAFNSLFKVSLWFQRLEYPAIDDTDGEDSEDERIGKQVLSNETYNASDDVLNVSTTLGDARRAIKKFRIQQKMKVLGKGPEVRSGDRKLIRRLKAKQAVEEEGEAHWAAGILQWMDNSALPLNAQDLASLEAEGSDLGLNATASDSKDEEAATRLNLTAMTETRIHQQRHHPNLSTYRRIVERRNPYADERLDSLSDRHSVTFNPRIESSGKVLGKRQRELMAEKSKTPKSKRVKATETRDKISSPHSASQRQAQTPQSEAHTQQQAPTPSPIDAPTQPRMTKEDQFAEIGRQAARWLATAGRVMRKTTRQNSEQPTTKTG